MGEMERSAIELISELRRYFGASRAFSLHCDSLESKNDREEVSEANGFEAHS